MQRCVANQKAVLAEAEAAAAKGDPDAEAVAKTMAMMVQYAIAHEQVIEKWVRVASVSDSCRVAR